VPLTDRCGCWVVVPSCRRPARRSDNPSQIGEIAGRIAVNLSVAFTLVRILKNKWRKGTDLNPPREDGSGHGSTSS
jgi:hypothetical protein